MVNKCSGYILKISSYHEPTFEYKTKFIFKFLKYLISIICGEEIFDVFISFFVSKGDKFASRAGQKGILSQKWPAEDLPFTESGLIPDIVFNPHGFPSRMTIAMMIETMAGKSGALHGYYILNN